MPIELDKDLSAGNEISAGTEGSSQASPSGDGSDYKARYAGQVTAYNRLREQASRKQSELEQTVAALEEKINLLTGSNKELEGSVAALTTAKTAAEESAKAFQSKLDLLVKQKEVEATVADKYPSLTQMALAGDLKLPGEFADEAAYDTYLQRMAKFANPAPDRGAGVTPPPPRRGTGEKRSLADVYAELDQLNSASDPQKFDSLIEELSSLQRQTT